jgi:Polyphosphate kinase 2 (PPK2)
MYLQRYLPHFPAAVEVIIFDRSWYNRAGVEQVKGFCTARPIRCPPLDLPAATIRPPAHHAANPGPSPADGSRASELGLPVLHSQFRW